jgi:hypothetical protein
MGTILLIILVLLLIGGATSLAVQFRLGILAKWRTGLNSFDYNHPRLDRTYLSEGQDSV